MSFAISSSRYPTASFVPMRAIGNPVALDASADERDTRGFISITSIVAVARIDRELDVAAAGIDADLADDRDRGVPHPLVFAIGERHRRRHGDRIAGVHAHRIEVLDRADDHDVVVVVAHDLELELLPPEHALLDQHLVRRATGRARAARSLVFRRGCTRCRRPCRPA